MSDFAWRPELLARIDAVYDRERADDRRSRYGAYLRQRPDAFHEHGQPHTPLPAAEFAAAAWTIATGPVMSPGYVRLRPDLQRITAGLSDDGEGRLVFDIHLPLRHHALTCQRMLRGGWADWEAASSGLWGTQASRWVALWEPDSNRRQALLASVVLRLVADDTWPLPTPTHTAGPGLLTQAQHAIAVITDELNHRAGPTVAALTDIH